MEKMIMGMIEYFRRQLAYNIWADRLIIASLREASDQNGPALRTLTHLLMAEREWLFRMRQETAGNDFWPEMSIAQCETLAEETHAAYISFFDRLTEDGLDAVAAYANSKGVAYATSFRDILTHVLFHSAYHRGQIAASVRSKGDAPAYTDYIAFVREQK
jgi:uncharacterized damage-inducible protein DinB